MRIPVKRFTKKLEEYPYLVPCLMVSIAAVLTYFFFPAILLLVVSVILFTAYTYGFKPSLVTLIFGSIYYHFIYVHLTTSIGKQLEGGEILRLSSFVIFCFILSYFIAKFRRLRDALTLAKQKYETVITAAPDVIISTDSMGRIVFVSPRVFSILGYMPAELVGQLVSNIVPGELKELHSQKFRLYNKTLKRTFDWNNRAVPVLKKDGSRLLMEISLGDYVLGGQRFFTGILRDVSALKASEERYRIQFKSTPIPIFTWQKVDDDFVMTDFNDASLTLTHGQPSILLHQKASKAYADSPEIIGYMNEAFDNKTIIRKSGIYRMRTTGEERYLNASFAYVPDNTLLIHTEDITEQHEANEKLKESVKVAQEASLAKDQFLAILSHELRTPMATILGYSNLLTSKKISGEEQDVALKAIEHSAKVQTTLINDLLDVSRIASGKIIIRDLIVGVPGVVKQLVNSMRPQATEKHLILTENIPNEVLFVKGDPERLHQALMNIVENAIKFTEKGKVSISVIRRGLSVDIVVKDTGIGISPETMKKLFQKFSQGESSVRRRYKGLGLGLFITKSIIDLHHGTIHTESELGKGTTMTISLPLMSPPLAEPVTKVPDNEKTDLNGISVLLIDDDVDTLAMLKLSLQRYGAKVTAVDSADKARITLQENGIDVIVSDVGMPIEDGLTFMENLRKAKNNTPAIALTAFEGLQYELEAKNKGFNGFLSKPVGIQDLVSEILKFYKNGT